MPRRPRMYLPEVPAHIVQRGNNRGPCFFADADYRIYLHFLETALKRYKVSLHAYVLMTNHMHFLMTPSDEHGISRVMSLVNQQYVQYVNRTYQRTGTLWDGRHKASIICAERYLLLCYRYIELNPVRAGMVGRPEAYRWSSYRCNAWGEKHPFITDHELYLGLGRSQEDRCSAYRDLFRDVIPQQDLDTLRTFCRSNFPLGNDHFRLQVEKARKVKIGQPHRGRPRRLNGSRCKLTAVN